MGFFFYFKSRNKETELPGKGHVPTRPGVWYWHPVTQISLSISRYDTLPWKPAWVRAQNPLLHNRARIWLHLGCLSDEKHLKHCLLKGGSVCGWLNPLNLHMERTPMYTHTVPHIYTHTHMYPDTLISTCTHTYTPHAYMQSHTHVHCYTYAYLHSHTLNHTVIVHT